MAATYSQVIAVSLVNLAMAPNIAAAAAAAAALHSAVSPVNLAMGLSISAHRIEHCCCCCCWPPLLHLPAVSLINLAMH
jgi:hypothetical protein